LNFGRRVDWHKHVEIVLPGNPFPRLGSKPELVKRRIYRRRLPHESPTVRGIGLGNILRQPCAKSWNNEEQSNEKNAAAKKQRTHGASRIGDTVNETSAIERSNVIESTRGFATVKRRGQLGRERWNIGN
jgi:hypothetical protein